jgi:deoxycytidylate deaminase
MKIHYSYSHVDDDISKLKDDTYLKIAAEIAKKSTMTQKHGCVIVYKKQVIATGYNTMPNMFNHSLHAEINAIKKVKNRRYILKDCDLYIVRIGPDSLENVLKYSKPCANCTKCILNYKIRRVFYSTNFEYDEFLLKNNLTTNQDFEKLQLYRNRNFDTCY